MKFPTILAEIFLNFTLPLPKTVYDEIQLLKEWRHLNSFSKHHTSFRLLPTPTLKRSIARLLGAIAGATFGLFLLIPSAPSEIMNIALFNKGSMTEIFPRDWLATGNPIGVYAGDIFLGLLVLAGTTILGRTLCSAFVYGVTAGRHVGREILSGLLDGVLGARTVRSAIKLYVDARANISSLPNMSVPRRINPHAAVTPSPKTPDIPSDVSEVAFPLSYSDINAFLDNNDGAYLPRRPPPEWFDGPRQEEREIVEDDKNNATPPISRDNSLDSLHESDSENSNEDEIVGSFRLRDGL